MTKHIYKHNIAVQTVGIAVCRVTNAENKQATQAHIANEHLLHTAKHARLLHVRHVDKDIVCGMAAQWCAETLLVEVVTDEPNG